MSFDWESLIQTVAPTVASALGGPLAGMAVKALSEALMGKSDGNLTDIQWAAKADPDVLVKLKQVECDFNKMLLDNGLSIAKVDADDRSSARAREMSVHDDTPKLLAYGISVGFYGLVGILCFHGIPPGAESLVYSALGALGTGWTVMLSYYFGSSIGIGRTLQHFTNGNSKPNGS